jgi:hypothetical protein
MLPNEATSRDLLGNARGGELARLFKDEDMRATQLSTNVILPAEVVRLDVYLQTDIMCLGQPDKRSRYSVSSQTTSGDSSDTT